MSDEPWKTEQESTQEIDAEVLQDSLDRTRGRGGSNPPQQPAHIGARGRFGHDDAPGSVTRMDAMATPSESFESGPLIVDDLDEGVDPADIEVVDDLDDVDDEQLVWAKAEDVRPRLPSDPAPSLIGTLPGHDVAQALRARMGDVPDPSDRANAAPEDEPSAFSDVTRDLTPRDELLRSLEDGDTQTRLPDEILDAPELGVADSPLPAFAMDDEQSVGGGPHAWRASEQRHPEVATRPATTRAFDRDSTSISQAVAQARPPPAPNGSAGEMRAPAPTAIFDGPIPAMARRSVHDLSSDVPSERSQHLARLGSDQSSDELPRSPLETVSKVRDKGSKPVTKRREAPRPEDPRKGTNTAGATQVGRDDEPEARKPLDSVDIRISAPELESNAFAEDVPEEPTSVDGSISPLSVLGGELEEADIEEIVDEEIVSEDVAAPMTTTTSVAPKSTPFVFRAPSSSKELEHLDAEERQMLEERRFGPLIALYRQRLAQVDAPNKRAALLVKIASVYETSLEDINQAFDTLVEAFELAPGNEIVITAIDRVGKEAGRIGELADRVKKRLVPGAPDDKRATYLGHLVYWYERVLGRGGDVASLVSEIERQDRVHPVVLKRAAQLAAMNGDTKTQREHLLRALERTARREEKVTLQLALASAYAGTADALKHYQAALDIDPTSIVALQGVKRLGKEAEQYAQVQWALEQQAEVAPTEAERIDALLELAELQETKFLKRELAAELLERVLQIEPSHPTALKGLERCYHALREWPKLARILRVRALHTFDKKAKVELLELAAEVYESKLGDFAGAVEVCSSLLEVEPKHRRALGDLARLYEKLGDWANVASCKARLAELAPTKRASSQELVKLGDFLNAPERDPLAAKLQYERAVSVDPTNATAWEALQKLAAANGDERRVIECLEQRKEHTDVPRQRAVVLVELANVHLKSGDEDAARQCFEEAILADSSNEAAAVAMLDAYAVEERWTEAAPLCELLVNAAIRDRDGEALFVRLRLSTRITAALGDADRAITSAIAALDARPTDPGAQADLIALCAQSPAALERSRAHIMAISESIDELAADVLVRLAGLLRDCGDLDGAAASLERARSMEPEDREIAKELSEVYLAQADFPRACKLKVDLARNATSADERFNLFVEAGEIWARRAEELEKAASVFEEASAIKPMDPWLLETLSWLYGELSDWQKLSRVLTDIAEIQDKPEERLKTLITLAQLLRDKLGDRLRAADLFDEVLDIDKKRLDIFEELVRALTEEKNWEQLERAYRRMIARVDDDESQLKFLLFQQLGLIYRDRLGDASRAFDALDAASRLRPDDGEVRKIVIELLVVTDNLDNAVARVRSAIDRDPHDPELYAELYDLFLRQHFFDKAWCAVNVLAGLREPTPEQRRFHEDYAPIPLDQVPGQIVEQAWRSHIFHADLEPTLTTLFSLMTPAVARLRFGQLRPEQRVGRPFTPTHSWMHDPIRTTFNNAAEILSMAAPELLLADAKLTVPFAPALAPFGSILVCVPQVEAQASSLVYLVGKRLAEQRGELSARAFFPSVPELTSLLSTAVRVSRNEVAKDAASTALDASFTSVLTPQERDGIRNMVVQATSDGASLDVKRWSQVADLSSMRAGLLLCGDVEPARQGIEAESAAAGSDLSTREKIGELYKFATSDLYSDLRGAIGVAVEA